MKSQINNDYPDPPEFHGAALELQSYTGAEVILSGPARASKTFPALYKFHRFACLYPRSKFLFIRQTRESLTDSALVTFEDDVLRYGVYDDNGNPATSHIILSDLQRSNRHAYPYTNGSEIVVAGFRQSRVDQTAKIMSTEYDGIFINELPELLESQYQKLTTRLTHFATPYQQLIGDQNPPSPTSWVWGREKSNLAKILYASLKDNPRWFDHKTNEWTKEGQEVYYRLSQLTGVLKDRLFYGKSVAAEGLIFGDVWSDGPVDGNIAEDAEYDPNVGSVIWFIDDGYSAGSASATNGIDPNTGYYVADSHPRVILFIQIKPDGHIDIFNESYACKKLTDVHIKECLEVYPSPDYAVHGHGTAEIRGRLQAADIPARQFTGKVDDSIKEMRSSLASDANGWRRVRVHPRCRNLRAEMVTFAYEIGTEKPLKQFDHGPEACRGGLWVLRFER